VVAEVESDDGKIGIGVTIGGEPAAFIIENHLSRFVEGQDPRDVELMWDQMWRGTINYGRKGLPIQAISAVDIAIWDLLGHIRNEPVYAMLGGTVRVFRQNLALEDAIGSHACSLEANMSVTNDIPLRSPLLLPLSP
jgi:L-rhamnonate dehydratase